jgi:hypothetical protein
MSSPPLVVPPEVWTRLPGTEWEVWHARKSVVIIGPHPKGTHGLAVRQRPAPDQPITPQGT